MANPQQEIDEFSAWMNSGSAAPAAEIDEFSAWMASNGITEQLAQNSKLAPSGQPAQAGQPAPGLGVTPVQQQPNQMASPQLMEDPLGGPPVMPFGSEPDPYSPPLQQAKPKEPAGYWERVGQTNPLRILDSMASGMTNAAYFGFDDEIAGAASWLGVPGLGNYKANQDRMRAEQPIAFMGGQMSTAFLPTGGALKALNPSTLKGTAAVGGATGMAQGALHGFGDTDGSLEQRNEGAQLGGLTGGAFGTVLTGGSRLLPEMLGDMSRGVRKQLPKGVPGAIEKAPSLKDLEALKNAAYKQVDESGVRYSPDGYVDMVGRVEKRLVDEGIDEVLHPKAARTLKRMLDRVGQSPTLSELDNVRKFVSRDVAGSMDPSEKRLGSMMIEEIDEFVKSGEGMLEGAGRESAETISKARELNTRFRKAETIEDAVRKAEQDSAVAGSGGNFENRLRAEIKSILQNPKKVRGFSAEEVKLMEQVVMGSPIQNLARLFGKASPMGNGLMGAVWGVGSYNDPSLLIPAVGSILAKNYAGRAVRGKVNRLSDMVRRGS